tara:strand:- start:211 stop:894 length:684 start_codon:yes stop_codon:yes gene_type:complete
MSINTGENDKNNTVLVYSIPRTGSTLIWQCLNNIYTKVLKSHKDQIWDYSSGFKMHIQKPKIILDYSCPCIISERDNVDTFLSWYKFINNFNLELFKEKCAHDNFLDVARKTILDFQRYLKDLEEVKLYYKGPILVLQYEKFWNNYDYIFCEFERFLKITLSTEVKNRIRNTTNRKTNMLIQNQMKSTYDHDEKTHIHGNHISFANPGYSEKILNEKVLIKLKEIFK